MIMRALLLPIFFFMLVTAGLAQDRFAQLAVQLESAVVDHPGLEGRVELSVSNTPVAEFVRALGVTHNLNLTIDPAVKGEVVNNFSDARVIDVIMFLCKQYDLELEQIGSILALRPYQPPVAPIPPPSPPRELSIRYVPDSALVDLDLRRDTLSSVARAISEATGTNVVLAPGLENKLVSVFIKRSTLPNAIEKLAFANSLLFERTKDGTFQLRENVIEQPIPGGKGAKNNGFSPGGAVEVAVHDGDLLVVDARNAPLSEVVQKASQLLNKNFFLYDALDKTTTLHLEMVQYDELLTHILKGSEFTYQFTDGIYLIGKRNLEGLRLTELVRLHHRPIKDVLTVIPEGIKANVSITEFIELNGFVLSGDALHIKEIKTFLRSIDQLVPVVMIEVLIVDVNRSRSLSTGIKAGLGEGPATTGGSVLPGVDMTLNSNSINSLINSFNGYGLFNLGNVTPNFYVSLQAMETDGLLRLRSTPQLSTLNGHEATMSIGQTEFYLEIQNNLIGTQNPTLSTSQVYKPIKADLSLKILPIVSSEDMVTLEIEVNQSSFTSRISATAPPGSVERKFSSIIRAANKDMIILGGLEEKENSKSGSGLPLLSRIPILKWFFGSRSSKMRKSKLTIFIRPTIIY